MKALDRAGLYLRTARHLRPRQIAFQVLRRVIPARTAPSPPALPATRLPAAGAHFIEPAADEATIEPLTFRFVGLERDFSVRGVDWACADMPRLWRYNLHYFDWMLDPRRAPESIVR